MNWEMLAAIGQLAAVCVGIPSLIYLAMQIRAQTSERRQSAVNALTVQWGDLTCALHESAEFTAIYLRGLESFDDLDPVSKLRFSSFFNRFFKNFQAMYFSRCDGILAANSFQTTTSFLRCAHADGNMEDCLWDHRQTGSLATGCNALGPFILTDYGVELLPLLKCCEKHEHFAVGCYCFR